MNYLTQYIIENQLLYYNIFFRPIYVLNHLLFSSTDCVNGNPCETVSFHRKTPFTEYYKETKTLKENIEYYELYKQEQAIESAHNSSKYYYECFHSEKSEQELWKLSLDKYYKNFNKIEFLNDKLLLDYDYWYNQLVESTDNFFPFIGNVENYHLINQLNDQTDKLLLNVSKIILNVLIDFYNNCISFPENIPLYRTPYRGETTEQTIVRIKLYLKELLLLQERLNEFH